MLTVSMYRTLADGEGKTFAQEILEEYGHSLNMSTWNGSLSNIPDSLGDGCSNELANMSRPDSGISPDIKSVSPTDKHQVDHRKQRTGHEIPTVNALNGDEDVEDGCTTLCHQYGDRKSPDGVVFPLVDFNYATAATGMF